MSDYDTPLHELCALAKQLGLHIDLGIYTTGCEYEGGARITGSDDPMDSVGAGVRALKSRLAEQEPTGGER